MGSATCQAQAASASASASAMVREVFHHGRPLWARNSLGEMLAEISILVATGYNKGMKGI